MAKLSALQEQLLKAGLVKKAKAAEAAREQVQARHSKGPPVTAEVQREAERAREEKVKRDRALEAERKAEQRRKELRAQARQIIDDKQVPGSGDSDYRFPVDGAIRSLLVSEAQRRLLSAGQLVIVRRGEGFALLPRLAAEKVRERVPEWLVLDHAAAGGAAEPSGSSEDDAYYAQFKVPDDLVW